MMRIAAIIFTCLGVTCTAFAAQPRLQILAPRGGEFYFDGQVQQIQVQTRIKSLIVELSRDGGATFEKIGTIDNTIHDASLRNILAWTVKLPASKLCMIRVSDSAGLFTQTSQQFRIGAVEGNAAIPAGTITSTAIADDAVTTAKISNLSVDSTKLANDSVTTLKLEDGSVTTPKLADGAVTTPKLADLSVSAQKITSGPSSAQFLLAADGLGGAAWMPPASIVVTPNFGNQPIVTTGSVTSGSVLTTDLTVNGTVTLPNNSIAAAALPAATTLQGNTFNGASQLVKLDNAGKLPALDASALVNLNLSILGGQNASYYLNRANHTGTQLANTISNFDTQVRSSRLNQMTVPNASLDLNSQKITNLADPAAAQDAATKNYVDGAGTTLNTAIGTKVSKTGDTMTGTLTAGGDTVKIAAKAGAGDATTVTKLEVLKSDNSTAFKVTANGDVTGASFVGPLTGTASNAAQLNSQAASYYLNRTNHTGSQLAATISDFDTQVRTSRLNQMTVPNASLELNSQNITNLADPAAAQDAATKNYVDGAGTALNNSKVSKSGDTMSGTLTAGGNGVKIAAQAGAGDAASVTKLEVLKSDNSTAFKVTANGDVTGTSFVGPLTGTASNATQLNGQAASYYLSRANHTGSQLAATISDFDTQVRTSRLNQMAMPNASLDLNSQNITNLADPAAAQDAATKNYVDGAGTTLNNSIAAKVSKTGDTMSGTLTAGGDAVKIAAKAGAGDATTVTKLEVLKSDNSTAFKVTANGDVTGTNFVGPLTGTASNATQLNSQAASYYLSRANHTGSQLAATISDFDTQVRTSRLNQMTVPNASLDLNSQNITNLADPAAAQDAATKNYVDGAGTTLNTAIGTKVSKTGDTMTGTLTAGGDAVKIAAKAGVGDATTVTKLEVLKSDNSTAFKVTANGDVTGTSFVGPLTGTASNATQLNSQAASYYLSRANHTGSQLAATISDFDTQVRTSRLNQMTVPNASLDLNSQNITNLADPAAAQDAATKNYVDGAGTTLNNSIATKVSKTGDTMTGTLTAAGDTVKIAAKAGAGDASSVTKLEVLKSDNSSAFKVTANGDVTGASFTGPLTGTASNATQLNGQAASYYLDRTNHTGTQLAATISDFDTQVRTSRLNQMTVPNASLDLNTQKITNLSDPAALQDAATKNYVDNAGTALNNSKVSKTGDTMSGTLAASGNGVKLSVKAGAGDASNVTKLEVLKSDNSSAFNVSAGGDVNVGGVMTLQKAGIPAVVNLASTGTVATDASLANVFAITLSGNVTLQAPSNPTSGQRCLWRFRQPASGGPFTVTLDTGVNGFRFGADIPSISLSTAANKTDYIGAIWNSVDSKWDVIAFVQGY